MLIADQPIVRLGLRSLLNGRFELEETESGEAGLELLIDIGPFDIAIIDMRVQAGDAPGSLSGAATVRALTKAQPGLGIVALGDRAERHLAREALTAGATAYVARRSPARELARAVEAAAEAEQFIDSETQSARRVGGRALTKRQREILQLFANGNSTARVARQLGLSGETIKTHTKEILSRLEARDRAHAVAIGMRSALID